MDLANSAGRYARLEARLRDRRGGLTVDHLVDCLRDQIEQATGEARPGGDVVLNFYNIGSVVADVTEGRLWVTVDPAPSALGRYVRFDLHKELDGFCKERAYPLDVLPPSGETPSKAAVGHLLRAHVALARSDDLAATKAELVAAHRAVPEDGRICLDLALLTLRMADPESAAHHALRFLELAPASDRRRHRGHLALAWSHDLAKRSPQAQVERARARAAAEGARAAVLEVSAWCKPLAPRDCSRMQIDLFNSRRLT